LGNLVKGVSVSWTLRFDNGVTIEKSDDDDQVATLSGQCATLKSQERSVYVTLVAQAEGMRRSERFEILLPARPEGWELVEDLCRAERREACGCSASTRRPAGLSALWLGLLGWVSRRRQSRPPP
jgi:uncharacterized protein (TIGR03382 family)